MMSATASAMRSRGRRRCLAEVGATAAATMAVPTDLLDTHLRSGGTTNLVIQAGSAGEPVAAHVCEHPATDPSNRLADTGAGSAGKRAGAG